MLPSEILGPEPGLLDLARPLLGAIDGALAFLPPVLRLVFWAAAAAALSMAIYRALSPQRRIRSAKADALEARRALDGYDGDLAGAWPLMARAIGAALRPIRLELGPAILASLPVVVVIVWLSAAYGYSFPAAGGELPARAEPDRFSAWLLDRPADHDGAGHRLRVASPTGETADIPLSEPVPVLAKRHWWNLLAGNPAGYLPESSPVERIEVPVAAREVLLVGPSWARGWHLVFFATLVVCSLLAKRLWRIA